MTNSTISTNATAVTRGVLRWLVRETMGVVMACVILFLCAGHWDWVWGWSAVATLVFWVGATALAVIPTHPAVLAERTRPRKGSKSWDTVFMSIVAVIVLAVYVVGGLDERNGWTVGFPEAVQILGVIVAVIGYALFVWATASNAFFSQMVRIQEERGHAVATGGPYQFVRHPGYLGGILAYVGMPMMLGSLPATALGLATAVLMVVCTSLEDRTLLRELNGYREFAARVRYRLLPGLW